jgi:hypothetical protein
MASYSDEGFDHLATTVRTALGIDDQVKPDAIDFLRRLKHTGYISDYVRVPDADLPDAEAKYVPHDRKIYIRESVYRAAQNEFPHDRFTVFHEGSHAILGHQFERKRSFDNRAKGERRVPSIRSDETDANKLAGALMAPYAPAGFTLETTPADIAAKFALSPRAAAIRHQELAGMYRRAKGLRRPLPSGVVDFLTEQKRRGHVVTSLPAEEIIAAKPDHSSYTGDSCPNPMCGEFKMMRNGTSCRCAACGCITGDG